MKAHLNGNAILLLILGFLAQAISAATPAINGRAVSVAWRGGFAYEGVGRGSIVKMTIQNGGVTRCDTIYRRSQGLAQYPAFNLAGTRVAFYRWQKQTVGNGEVCGTSNSSTIAVIDIDGTNLRDLVTLPAAPGNEPVLDWPAGDWIYYKNPRAGANPQDRDVGDIWRVDVNDPTMNQRVVYYTGWGTGTGENWLRRWSISLDGKRAGGQFNVILNSPCQNLFHAFPPLFGDYVLSGIFAVGNPVACNGSICASGIYGATYFDGSHAEIFIQKWNPVTNDIGGTTSFSLGNMAQWIGNTSLFSGTEGCELIRWAVNSDKWVLQQVGWWGHAANIEQGANQFAGNWVDKQAIMISNNPRLPQNSQPPYGNCPGDLWIDGGAAAVGKYEDTTGNWIAVDPVGTYAKIDVSGTGPYTITLSGDPSGSDLYYT
jgi:hypothetical protein